MKNHYTILFIILLILSLLFYGNASAQFFYWVKQAGGADYGGSDKGKSISADASGNSYVTGEFYGTATLLSSSIIRPRFSPPLRPAINHHKNTFFMKTPAKPDHKTASIHLYIDKSKIIVKKVIEGWYWECRCK